VRFAPFRAPEVNLQPLKFELPLAITSETKFVGRDWAYGEMLNALGCNDSKLNKGVVSPLRERAVARVFSFVTSGF